MKKIVIITFESYVKEAHPYCLETLDYIASNGSIIEVEILDFHCTKLEPMTPELAEHLDNLNGGCEEEKAALYHMQKS